MPTQHISVVIPTFNRAPLFRQTIPALKNQIPGDFTYEVIYVSNGSTDETGSILTDVVASAPQTFRYFRIEPTGGPAGPRNFGIRKAIGDVIVIIDDDVVPHEDLVLRHTEFHKRHPALNEAAVGQVYVPPALLDDPMSVFHSQYSYDSLYGKARLSFLDFWTCNISLKRQFVLEHGMFDEKILDLEDIELGYRLEQAGLHLYFLPAAQGQHLHKTNPERITARASAAGGWLYKIAEGVPGAVVQKRWGLVSRELGYVWCVKRMVRLTSLLLIDNPVTRMFLRLLGATRSKRNRVTDAYYGMMFKRAFLLGYYRAWFTEWRRRSGAGSVQQ